MMYQAKFLEREQFWCKGWKDAEIREWKLSSLLPEFDVRLDLRVP
jgi:hypothetical protein